MAADTDLIARFRREMGWATMAGVASFVALIIRDLALTYPIWISGPFVASGNPYIVCLLATVFSLLTWSKVTPTQCKSVAILALEAMGHLCSLLIVAFIAFSLGQTPDKTSNLLVLAIFATCVLPGFFIAMSTVAAIRKSEAEPSQPEQDASFQV